MDEPVAPAEKKTAVRTFAAAAFLNDMGSDIIYPVWPLFVTEVLKANMAALGFIDGLGDAVVSLSQAASGYVSDRIGRRKPFIWAGYLCGGLSRLGYAASTVWQHLIPFRVLDRAGKIRNAPRDAMIADLTTAGNRGGHFGLLRAMDNAGAFAGIVLSILLLPVLGYRALFALAALPSLAAVGLVLRNIREARPSARRLFKGLSLRDLSPQLLLFVILNGLFSLGAFSYSFLLIYAKRAGFKSGLIPVLYLVYTAAAALLSLPMGRLADRIGRKPVLFLAFGIWGGICLVIALGAGLPVIAGLFVLYGAHKAALDPVQRTMAAELAPPALRASTLGAFQMIVGLAALPASLGAGILWERFGPAVPFLLSLALTGAAASLLAFVREQR